MVERLTESGFPLPFILIDSLVLLIAVVRVWTLFRDEKEVSVNKNFMTLHLVMLFLLTASQFYASIFANID